jgi:hypothetical protein
MTFVAATAMLFAACGREEGVVGDNEVLYDDVPYSMYYVAKQYRDFIMVNAFSEEVSADGNPMVNFANFRLYPAMEGRTFDLTRPTGDDSLSFGLQFRGVCNFQYYCQWGTADGILEGENSVVFRSGRLTIARGRATRTVDMDAVLANGHTLKMRLCLADADIR